MSLERRHPSSPESNPRQYSVLYTTLNILSEDLEERYPESKDSFMADSWKNGRVVFDIAGASSTAPARLVLMGQSRPRTVWRYVNISATGEDMQVAVYATHGEYPFMFNNRLIMEPNKDVFAPQKLRKSDKLLIAEEANQVVNAASLYLMGPASPTRKMMAHRGQHFIRDVHKIVHQTPRLKQS